MQLHRQPAVLGGSDGERAAGERAVYGLVERGHVADFADCLKRGGHVGAVMTQHRRARADLAGPGGRSRIGAELVVEPPGPDPVSQAQQLRGTLRVGELAEHAVVLPDRERLRPLSVVVPDADEAAQAIAQHRRRPQQRPVPYALPLDLRVAGECRLSALRQAQVDGVAEVVLAEAQLERDGVAPPGRPLYRVAALPDRAPDLLRAG